MLKITGLNDLNKKLDQLAKNAEALDGQHNVPISELLTSTFLSKHTRFSTIQEFFDASGFKVNTQEDFAAIPDNKWNEFIRSVSSFENWQAMLKEAGKEWAGKKLGF